MNAHVKVRAQVAFLPGGRLHLNDGPIDLVIGAFGAESAVRAAYKEATRRFSTILDELCEELPLLRSAVLPSSPVPHGPTAKRMDAAVRPFAEQCFVTRMAAVAGGVADEILAAVLESAELDRAYVQPACRLRGDGDARLLGELARDDDLLLVAARKGTRQRLGLAAADVVLIQQRPRLLPHPFG